MCPPTFVPAMCCRLSPSVMSCKTFSRGSSNIFENVRLRVQDLSSDEFKGPASKVTQIKEDAYESYDDFLEMVIQFGYITIFASAFPFSSALSIITNLVEIKTDMFKLLCVYQRPIPRRATGIGGWRLIMDATVLLSVTTNCMLFALSSEQLMQWIPLWFVDHGGPGGDQSFRAGMGRFVVGLCFGIEHILLLLVATLWVAIPEIPLWVRQKVARVHYLRQWKGSVSKDKMS
ncbi:unnamed protein product [Discosporangium mesarthrocarpum]